MGFEKIFFHWCLPAVMVVTDRELALMNGIQIVFPQAANLICIWHKNKNIIVARCRTIFVKTKDIEIMTWTAFMKRWESVVHSPNKIFILLCRYDIYKYLLRKTEQAYL